MNKFIKNFNAIKWDTKKEVFILFLKVLAMSLLSIGILVGLQYALELIARSL